ncbi:hypothetical protein CAOG_00021 [Capsaspora owczarzaki ATCC 30864]|uniref:Peptidase M48 domain-containing protein n=1 Tax=Capsaspora owczarzaki (strain ATCC 30864) TaxID=595528 RepID=A0A0D2X033_CAPO3|nr:hypothetical protein CAOG_00021 [Capsaspora owczarzaki ATCC 30864]KJE88359.1 hypothetical protein CAOG_000021 [Capsaspora owczarzaki ATCC 30864]|eukprot:XP_004364892.2 hypothetical protein CAOG_00021 [Capsaspora owczarzaki ATCC 30864]
MAALTLLRSLPRAVVTVSASSSSGLMRGSVITAGRSGSRSGALAAPCLARRSARCFSTMTQPSLAQRSFQSNYEQQQQQQQQRTPPHNSKLRFRVKEVALHSTSFRLFVGGVAALLAYAWYQAEEVPFTGRRRMLLLPAWLEKLIGNQTDQGLVAETREMWVSESSPAYQLIREVGERICTANGIPPLRYHLVRSNEPNAFVTPGGTVFVYTGILPIMQNEHGAAVVLSHEIGHYIAHHSSEQVLFSVILGAFRLLWDWNSALLSSVFKVAAELPLSRSRETEADLIGLMLMARACFNIDEAQQVWKRFDDLAHQDNPVDRAEKLKSWLSTHPSHSERLKNFDPKGEWMAKARVEQDKACLYGQALEEQPSSPLSRILRRHRERRSS